MKLDAWEAVSSILEAGGTFQNEMYACRNSNGAYHREDGPAVVYPDGTQHWYRNGMFHRDDGPAVILPDGTQKWYRNGQLIRVKDK